MAEIKDNKKSSNTGKIILIILTVLLLGLNAIQFYFNHTQKKKIVEKDEKIETQGKQIEDQIAKLETLQADLEATSAELESLGADNSELKAQLEDLQSKIAYAKSRPNISHSKLRELKAQVAQYSNMLKQQEVVITDLKQKLAIQDTMITDLKVEKTALIDTVSTKNSKITYLSEEVEKGKKLKAHDFVVTAVKKNGKEHLDEIYKSKELYKVKVDFTVGENPIADIEQKDVFVQITEPNGNTIYDLQQGGGELKKSDGSSTFYTIKNSVTYNRSAQRLTVFYQKNSDYVSGTHKVNVFADGVLIGSGEFQVK